LAPSPDAPAGTRRHAQGMTNDSLPPEPVVKAIENLTHHHHEHEKYYSEAPLHDAAWLQRASRTLLALAERWSVAVPAEDRVGVPFAGATDINDERAIETSGVLFLEGDEPPAEIVALRQRLDSLSASFEASGHWLFAAMETGWDMALALLDQPALAGVLGERHRIISNDWLNASTTLLVARHLERAGAILDRVDFRPDGVRADLAGARVFPAYLYSACEIIDRAADLVAVSATVVHDNERRWRVVNARVRDLSRDGA
jgi:hypothetical protein